MVSRETKEKVFKFIRKHPAYPSEMRANLRKEFPELSYGEILRTLGELDREGKIVYEPYTKVHVTRRYKFQKVGVDAITGNSIYWDPIENNYALKHKRTGVVLKRASRIEVTETVSVETEEGHAVPFLAEATASTMLVRRPADEVERVTDELQIKLDDYFHSKEGFDQIESRAQKKGIEYRFGRRAPQWTDASVFIEKKKQRKYRYPETGREEVDLGEY